MALQAIGPTWCGRCNFPLVQQPAYAPELNPVEYLWADTKTHDLAQFCPHDLDELTAATDTALGNKPHDQHRLAGYLRKSGLPLRLKIKPQP